MYRFEGRLRRLTLGVDKKELTLAQARTKAGQAREALDHATIQAWRKLPVELKNAPQKPLMT